MFRSSKMITTRAFDSSQPRIHHYITLLEFKSLKVSKLFNRIFQNEGWSTITSPRSLALLISCLLMGHCVVNLELIVWLGPDSDRIIRSQSLSLTSACKPDKETHWCFQFPVTRHIRQSWTHTLIAQSSTRVGSHDRLVYRSHNFSHTYAQSPDFGRKVSYDLQTLVQSLDQTLKWFKICHVMRDRNYTF